MSVGKSIGEFISNIGKAVTGCGCFLTLIALAMFFLLFVLSMIQVASETP